MAAGFKPPAICCPFVNLSDVFQGTGSCQKMMGVGLCTYDATAASLKLVPAEASRVAPAVGKLEGTISSMVNTHWSTMVDDDG